MKTTTTTTMATTLRKRFRSALAPVALALLIAGCASNPYHEEGIALIDQGRYEEGLTSLQMAVQESPREPRYRATLAIQRDRIIASQLARGDRARLNGEAQAAEEAYRQVLRIDANNDRAKDALRVLELQRNLGEMEKIARGALQRGDLEQADRQVAAMLNLDGRYPGALELRKEVELLRVRNATPYPQLRTKFARPISLEFRDANIKVIFDVLSRTTGLNFILDKDVKADLKATIFVKQVAVEDALDLLLTQSQLEKKIVNENTMIVYPNTPQKLKEYQDLVIKSFYLGNIEAKQAQALIKQMLKTKDVFIDEKLNTLTMRDTPDAIRLAEKMLLAQDQAEPEVLLEIEVLEISRKRILDLGIQWPSTFTALNPNLGSITLLDQLKGISSSRIGVNGGPVARINANDNDVNTLANPVIRVRNREKARIHIGDKIPIVSATQTPSTQGPVTTETITYLDVGLKIEVEPTIYVNDEVGIKINLEVSNSTSRGVTNNGSTLVEVSTRNASTGLRLKDGETQVLAGLLRNDLANSGNKIPGLGDMPGVGRLFGSNQDTMSKTELILSVKPRIIRNLPTLPPQQMEYPSGTEGTLKAGGVLLRTGTESEPVTISAPSAAPSAAPAASQPRPAAAPAKPAAAAAPTLTLSWDEAPALKVGEEGTAVLRLKTDAPVISTALQIGFDPAVVKIVEATEGDLLKQDGTTSFTTRLDDQAGRLFVGLSRSGGSGGTSGATGEGTLVQLRLQGVSAADASALRLVVFSGVGPGNRLLPAPLPEALNLSVAP